MSKYLSKISKLGKDVKTCGYNDLIFTSEFPLLKIHKQGSGSITIKVTGQTITIPHTTGITPMFIAFTEWYDINSFEKADNYRQFSFSEFQGVVYCFYNAWTDNNNLYLYYEDMGTNTLLKYYYFIFEDPIT